MAQTRKKERPALGRPAKYEFFDTLRVGGKSIVSTEGMTDQERLRLLRNLRSIGSQKKTHYGRAFRSVLCSNGIIVVRLA